MVAEDSGWLYIDGERTDPGAGVREVVEAANGEPLGAAPMASAQDVDRAARAARRAFTDGDWARSGPVERASAMRRFAAAFASMADSVAELVSRQNGTPIGLSRALNGALPSALLRRYADRVEALDLEEVRGTTLVRREPVGVVGAIAPWNYPQALAMYKIAPALAAGCTVVLKPSPETALDAAMLSLAAEQAGLPPGVLNVVPGDRDAGASLVSHPAVDKVAFTGSTAAGRLIGAECGRLIRRCTLELGGKSAAVVCEDADLDVLRAGLGAATFMNSGQTCTTQARILAPRSRYDDVVDTVVDYCRSRTIGDPLDPAVRIGPMVSARHRDRVVDHIEVGRSSGARLVTGGGVPAGLDRGWFVEPTVFADVDNADRLAQEEVFGPVVVVIPYTDDEDAIRITDASAYGLAGSVWSADPERATAIARRIRTGTVGINGYTIDLDAPFGGMKDSGLGRELGPEALDAYFELKSIYRG
ncbi:aldehyde dehydrogenase [Pseudonocardia endophytica]|uniref:Betaine-aldehyde dehydrogenase n=1 Tax=Pseudonocardia endophytica TaxID=401976 RepID=A0A4R1I1I6_PSEEN|nr:aldehyde dehydrogenase [Pseudonocardia endophytica]TCK26299.1 betaine-aldehyde dehydrogenase [Pseudonocardia endophytica]